MATVNSVNKTKQDVNVPPTIVPQGEINARMKVQYDEFSHTASPTTGDVVEFLPLPVGARIHDAVIVHGPLGSSGLVSLGWKAGVLTYVDPVDGQTKLVNPVDADGFVVAGSTKNAALNKFMASTVGTAGQFKKFSEAITPVMTFDEAPTVASATYKVAIYYTID